MDRVANAQRNCCRKPAEELCLDNNRGSIGHTPATFFRILFGTIALVVSIGLSSA